jgi:hypothetical protein
MKPRISCRKQSAVKVDFVIDQVVGSVYPRLRGRYRERQTALKEECEADAHVFSVLANSEESMNKDVFRRVNGNRTKSVAAANLARDLNRGRCDARVDRTCEPDIHPKGSQL